MEFDIFNPSRHLRQAVLFWLSMFLTGATIFIGYLSLASAQSHAIPLVEMSFGLFSAFVCFQTYRDNSSIPLRKIYIWSFMVTIAVSVLNHPIEHGVYIWSSLFPIMCYLILGKKPSVIVVPAGLIVILALIMWQIGSNPSTNHAHLLINFILSYLSIWAASHILEVKRTISEISLGNLASRDALTGVYNRHALLHNFERYRQESLQVPLSLLVLDLDYFKQINDAHGHDVGDRVLVQTAALVDLLTDEHLVYRIGGEEFCIALHNTNIKQATETAEHIRFTIENHHFKVGHIELQLTASIGVYQCDHFNSLECVLRKADIELYKAKKSGRNQVMRPDYSHQIHNAI